LHHICNMLKSMSYQHNYMLYMITQNNCFAALYPCVLLRRNTKNKLQKTSWMLLSIKMTGSPSNMLECWFSYLPRNPSSASLWRPKRLLCSWGLNYTLVEPDACGCDISLSSPRRCLFEDRNDPGRLSIDLLILFP